MFFIFVLFIVETCLVMPVADFTNIDSIIDKDQLLMKAMYIDAIKYVENPSEIIEDYNKVTPLPNPLLIAPSTGDIINDSIKLIKEEIHTYFTTNVCNTSILSAINQSKITEYNLYRSTYEQYITKYEEITIALLDTFKQFIYAIDLNPSFMLYYDIAGLKDSDKELFRNNLKSLKKQIVLLKEVFIKFYSKVDRKSEEITITIGDDSYLLKFKTESTKITEIINLLQEIKVLAATIVAASNVISAGSEFYRDNTESADIILLLDSIARLNIIPLSITLKTTYPGGKRKKGGAFTDKYDTYLNCYERIKFLNKIDFLLSNNGPLVNKDDTLQEIFKYIKLPLTGGAVTGINKLNPFAYKKERERVATESATAEAAAELATAEAKKTTESRIKKLANNFGTAFTNITENTLKKYVQAGNLQKIVTGGKSKKRSKKGGMAFEINPSASPMTQYDLANGYSTLQNGGKKKSKSSKKKMGGADPNLGGSSAFYNTSSLVPTATPYTMAEAPVAAAGAVTPFSAGMPNYASVEYGLPPSMTNALSGGLDNKVMGGGRSSKKVKKAGGIMNEVGTIFSRLREGHSEERKEHENNNELVGGKKKKKSKGGELLEKELVMGGEHHMKELMGGKKKKKSKGGEYDEEELVMGGTNCGKELMGGKSKKKSKGGGDTLAQLLKVQSGGLNSNSPGSFDWQTQIGLDAQGNMAGGKRRSKAKK